MCQSMRGVCLCVLVCVSVFMWCVSVSIGTCQCILFGRTGTGWDEVIRVRPPRVALRRCGGGSVTDHRECVSGVHLFRGEVG